jgi:hypothetical protein
MVLCFRKESRLARLAQSYRFVDLIDLKPPSIGDGFLATNSLLAFFALLVRGYEDAFSLSKRLPRKLEEILSSSQYIEAVRASCAPLWGRDTLVVLYGPSVSSAAVDLESKFSEAALGNVQLADFRNFAHGRHHWLAKRGPQTGVLAIFSNDEQDLADKTLRLIPSSIPVARICISRDSRTASVAALAVVLHIVGAAGDHCGIDPGRPGVPVFGRRIYGLRALRTLRDQSPSPETLAIDTPFELPTRDSIRTVILTLAADGLHPREIAERLNQLGLKSLQGKPLSAKTVAKRITEDERRCARKVNRAASLRRLRRAETEVEPATSSLGR